MPRQPSRAALIALILVVLATVAACDAARSGSSADEQSTVAEVPTGIPPVDAEPEATRTPLAVTTPVPTLDPRQELLPLVTPTPGASALLGPDGLPAGMEGPLVVYQRTLDNGLRSGVRRYEVITRDLGAARDVAVFEVGGTNVQIHLAGRRMLVDFGRVLHSYALDGSDQVTLVDRSDTEAGGTYGYVESVVPSPDGSLVAVNVTCEPPDLCAGFELPNDIYVLDPATAEQVVHIEQTAALPEDFSGIAAPIGWRADGRLVLGGHFHRDGGGGDAALLSLDGGIEVIRDPGDMGLSYAWNRALGRPQPLFEGNVYCGLEGFAGVSRIELVDPETRETLNAIEADAPVLSFYGFGPGGWSGEWDAVLVHELLIDHEERERWRQQVADGECPGAPWDFDRADPERWWVLPVDGSEPRRVESLLEARRAWDGERLVTFACGGLEVVEKHALGQQLGDECDWQSDGIELRVGGQMIATTQDPEFLGFVEVTDAP